MTGDGDSLGAQLEELLRRQAKRGEAPEWIRDVLEGKEVGATLEEEGDARVVVTRPNGDRFELELRLTFPRKPPVAVKTWKPEIDDEWKELAEFAKLSEEELKPLSYVVVDEIVGQDDADVSISSWPSVDERGRLVFPDEPEISVHISLEELTKHLNDNGFLWSKRSDELRMGTVLAVAVRTELLPEDGARLAPQEWLVLPAYDLTEPARAKAKEAFYAAVAPTLTEEQVAEIEQAADES
jgi:hypothetical protein